LLTDTALTRLDVDALLVELLDRIRNVLQAGPAAVLLLEAGSQELVARAARRIEEEILYVGPLGLDDPTDGRP
jgi:sigma-B regulation protein RsbU (phosphoserine phosphatase)